MFVFAGTSNAIHYLTSFGNTGIFDRLTPASPADTAMAVLRGGALRQRDVFYPYSSAKPVALFVEWFPNLLDSFVRSMNTRDEKPTTS